MDRYLLRMQKAKLLSQEELAQGISWHAAETRQRKKVVLQDNACRYEP